MFTSNQFRIRLIYFQPSSSPIIACFITVVCVRDPMSKMAMPASTLGGVSRRSESSQ